MEAVRGTPREVCNLSFTTPTVSAGYTWSRVYDPPEVSTVTLCLQRDARTRRQAPPPHDDAAASMLSTVTSSPGWSTSKV